MLKKEFQYYLDHQGELVEKYNNKFIVIIGENVVGVYDTQKQAYDETIRSHKLGTFLIQKVTPGNNDTTQTFHSRVILNVLG